MSKRMSARDAIGMFFIRLGWRFYMVVLLLISLALFAAPAVIGMRRAFSAQSLPTIPDEYREWLDWLDLLVVMIVCGEPVHGDE